MDKEKGALLSAKPDFTWTFLQTADEHTLRWKSTKYWWTRKVHHCFIRKVWRGGRFKSPHSHVEWVTFQTTVGLLVLLHLKWDRWWKRNDVLGREHKELKTTTGLELVFWCVSGRVDELTLTGQIRLVQLFTDSSVVVWFYIVSRTWDQKTRTRFLFSSVPRGTWTQLLVQGAGGVKNATQRHLVSTNRPPLTHPLLMNNNSQPFISSELKLPTPRANILQHCPKLNVGIRLGNSHHRRLKHLAAPRVIKIISKQTNVHVHTSEFKSSGTVIFRVLQRTNLLSGTGPRKWRHMSRSDCEQTDGTNTGNKWKKKKVRSASKRLFDLKKTIKYSCSSAGRVLLHRVTLL